MDFDFIWFKIFLSFTRSYFPLNAQISYKKRARRVTGWRKLTIHVAFSPFTTRGKYDNQPLRSPHLCLPSIPSYHLLPFLHLSRSFSIGTMVAVMGNAGPIYIKKNEIAQVRHISLLCQRLAALFICVLDLVVNRVLLSSYDHHGGTTCNMCNRTAILS